MWRNSCLSFSCKTYHFYHAIYLPKYILNIGRFVCFKNIVFQWAMYIYIYILLIETNIPLLSKLLPALWYNELLGLMSLKMLTQTNQPRGCLRKPNLVPIFRGQLCADNTQIWITITNTNSFPPAGASSCCSQPPLPSPAPTISSTTRSQNGRNHPKTPQITFPQALTPLVAPQLTFFQRPEPLHRRSAARRVQRATGWFGREQPRAARAPADCIYIQPHIYTYTQTQIEIQIEIQTYTQRPTDTNTQFQ